MVSKERGLMQLKWLRNWSAYGGVLGKKPHTRGFDCLIFDVDAPVEHQYEFFHCSGAFID